MQLHENPKPKVIAFHEGLAVEALRFIAALPDAPS